ncbi:DUF6194 family protein [Arsukibacterium sp.]|uniref:DUF6194 family protein n=1 Tax=Arsukibacterium sp. TaxID=1977258 RepID=UPI001BD28B2F
MDKQDVAAYILGRYAGLVAVEAWGEQSFFYNPDKALPRGVYFATVKDKDGDNDQASRLGRDGVFRFNFGISNASYKKVLGQRPARPVAGGVVSTGHDFSQFNTLLPHPVYAWMSWVCVVNPDGAMMQQLTPLLDESYALVVEKYTKRIKK